MPIFVGDHPPSFLGFCPKRGKKGLLPYGNTFEDQSFGIVRGRPPFCFLMEFSVGFTQSKKTLPQIIIYQLMIHDMIHDMGGIKTDQHHPQMVGF